MRIAVIGSSRFRREELAKEIVRSAILNFGDVCKEFVTGDGSSRVDAWVREGCQERGLKFRELSKASYSKLLLECADAIILVWNGSKRERAYSMARECEKRGKPLYAVNVNEMTCSDIVWKSLGMCGSHLLDEISDSGGCAIPSAKELEERWRGPPPPQP